MKRKNGSEISSASNSNSKETKGGRRMQFPNHLGLLGRERLLSNRKKNQMVKECRKLQLKVAKLTRSFPIAPPPSLPPFVSHHLLPGSPDRALDVANRRLRLAQSLKMEALVGITLHLSFLPLADSCLPYPVLSYRWRMRSRSNGKKVSVINSNCWLRTLRGQSLPPPPLSLPYRHSPPSFSLVEPQLSKSEVIIHR
jgi:hypothetical protein